MKVSNFFEHKRTMNTIIDSYLLYKKQTIKESTYYRYSYIINKYILPEFRFYSLNKLEEYDFNLFSNKLITYLSVKTVQDIIVVLKSILNFMEIKYKRNFNTSLICIPHQKSLKQIQALSSFEIKKLSKTCKNIYSLKSIGIYICLNTGMRLGEICALKWKNIDLEENIITIENTIQRIYIGSKNKKSKVIISSPKTRNSIRKIPINTKLKTILEKLNKEYSFDNEDFFLTNSSNKIMEPRNVQNYFKHILKASDIEGHNFHILRHTFASNCIKAGMDPKSLSQILGHTSTTFTLNRYVHSDYETQKKFLEAI